MKFWAGLGSQGCREKKSPNCHKYVTFWGVFFNFLFAKKSLDLKKNILASALKSAQHKGKKHVKKNVIEITMNQKQATYSEIHRGPDSMVSANVSVIN